MTFKKIITAQNYISIDPDEMKKMIVDRPLIGRYY